MLWRFYATWRFCDIIITFLCPSYDVFMTLLCLSYDVFGGVFMPTFLWPHGIFIPLLRRFYYYCIFILSCGVFMTLLWRFMAIMVVFSMSSITTFLHLMILLWYIYDILISFLLRSMPMILYDITFLWGSRRFLSVVRHFYAILMSFLWHYFDFNDFLMTFISLILCLSWRPLLWHFYDCFYGFLMTYAVFMLLFFSYDTFMTFLWFSYDIIWDLYVINVISMPYLWCFYDNIMIFLCHPYYAILTIFWYFMSLWNICVILMRLYDIFRDVIRIYYDIIMIFQCHYCKIITPF